jgi:hypothetical protein
MQVTGLLNKHKSGHLKLIEVQEQMKVLNLEIQEMKMQMQSNSNNTASIVELIQQASGSIVQLRCQVYLQLYQETSLYAIYDNILSTVEPHTNTSSACT